MMEDTNQLFRDLKNVVFENKDQKLKSTTIYMTTLHNFFLKIETDLCYKGGQAHFEN